MYVFRFSAEVLDAWLELKRRKFLDSAVPGPEQINEDDVEVGVLTHPTCPHQKRPVHLPLNLIEIFGFWRGISETGGDPNLQGGGIQPILFPDGLNVGVEIIIYSGQIICTPHSRVIYPLLHCGEDKQTGHFPPSTQFCLSNSVIIP